MNILSDVKITDIRFLKLCASITKGNTVYLGDFSLVPIDSWWNLIKRRWHSEDRYVMLRYIDLRVSKILSDLYAGLTNIDLDDLNAAISGLKQLSLTYESDEKFTSELSIVVSKMEHAIKTEKEKRNPEPEFFPTLISENREEDKKLEDKEGALAITLKKIRTWSEFHNRSPPQFTSSLSSGMKSFSFDSLRPSPM